MGRGGPEVRVVLLTGRRGAADTLGPVEARWDYRPLRTALARGAFWWVLLFAVAEVAAVMHGEGLAGCAGMAACAATAGAVLAALLNLGLRAGHQAWSVELRPLGLAFSARGQSGYLRWEEIRLVVVEPGGEDEWGQRRGYFATVEGRHARLITMTPGIAEVAAARAMPARWRAMIEAFDAGEPFSFGALTTTQTLLVANGAHWMWRELHSIERSGRHVVIRPLEGRPSRVLAREVSFVELLERLAQEQLQEGAAYAGRALPRSIESCAPLAPCSLGLPRARVVGPRQTLRSRVPR